MVKVGCFLVGTTSKTWRHEDLKTPQLRFLGPTSQCHGKTPASRFWGVFYRDNMMGLFFCLLIRLAIISSGKIVAFGETWDPLENTRSSTKKTPLGGSNPSPQLAKVDPKTSYWLVVSSHLRNISQIFSLLLGEKQSKLTQHMLLLRHGQTTAA